MRAEKMLRRNLFFLRKSRNIYEFTELLFLFLNARTKMRVQKKKLFIKKISLHESCSSSGDKQINFCEKSHLAAYDRHKSSVNRQTM